MRTRLIQRGFVAAAALVLAGGCSTMQGGLGRARTLPVGHVQGGVALEGTVIPHPAGELFLAPAIEGDLHYGVTDVVEVGARADFPWGLLAEVKVAMLRSPSE